jgi:hypothetical protein
MPDVIMDVNSFCCVLQATHFNLTLSETSIFAYRGPEHRTVVEMEEKDRTLDAIKAKNTAWLRKNKTRKSKRTTADRPLWSALL